MRRSLFSRSFFSSFWVLSSAVLINTWCVSAALAEPNVDWGFKSCKAFAPTKLDLLRTEDSAKIYEIHFTACDGNAIDAYWVTPEKSSSEKQPAILFVHWLDFEAPDSNRNEFLPDAKRLAKDGVSSLLVSTFWSVPGGRYRERKWENDYSNTLNQMRDLLQALQWMRAQKNVDTKRMAYVGHDYGATFGVLVSALDKQVKAFALMTPIAVFTDWYLYGSASGVPQGEQKEQFIKSFLPINPEAMIKKSNAQFLIQYALNDKYVSKDQADQLIRRTSKTTQVHFYPVDHSMKFALATEDRISWLSQVLK